MKLMTGKTDKDWQDWKNKNSNPYNTEIMRYVEAWANLMESEMSKGKKLSDIAEQTSYEANTTGITEFMYGAAVSILSVAWTYGEELRKWHNLKIQIRKEGEQANEKGGVLNPALLVIGDD